MKAKALVSALPPQTTDLERQVLAHDRVLQALIACKARTEPRFSDHLRQRFIEPMHMAKREHDHRETDDFAEEFIRAVMQLGEESPPEEARSASTGRAPVPPKGNQAQGIALNQPRQADGVQVSERNGIWKVLVDGQFRGDSSRKEHALAAAALHRLSLGWPMP